MVRSVGWWLQSKWFCVAAAVRKGVRDSRIRRPLREQGDITLTLRFGRHSSNYM